MSTVTFDVKSRGSRRSSRTTRTGFTRSSRSTRKTRRSRRGKRALKMGDFARAGLVPPRGSRQSQGVSSKRSRRITGGVVSRTPVPTQMSFCTTRAEENFRSTKINHPEHGVGSCVAFSSQLCVIGSNGNLVNADLQIAIQKNSLLKSLLAIGMITLDGNYVSGYPIHPRTISGRVEAEASLWGRWRFKWVKVTYQTYVGTNNNGVVYMALSRNPTLLCEGFRASTTTATPYELGIVETIPNMTVARFGEGSIDIKKFEQKMYMTDVFNLAPDSYDNAYGTIAYINERFPIRLVALTVGGPATAVVSPWGLVWIEGEIEFFNPMPASSYAIGTTISSEVKALGGIKTLMHGGEWKSPAEVYGTSTPENKIRLQIGVAGSRPEKKEKSTARGIVPPSRAPSVASSTHSVHSEGDFDYADRA